MRAKVVEKYFNNVMQIGFNDGITSEICKEMYRNQMDNRILNNLRQNMNEMIEDQRGIINHEDFKKMWFTFFKGETHA